MKKTYHWKYYWPWLLLGIVLLLSGTARIIDAVMNGVTTWGTISAVCFIIAGITWLLNAFRMAAKKDEDKTIS